ncbi:unnamed protein product [Nesidiocoris tenuis]|uniref:NADH dehydrogenase [ubiquinone] 1 beta subcomplex subunit 10 n=2 Tax=Nesidiocoris tenuis TaxID=355587 RepID=A0A6H5HMP0_9HEMI|nr:NADH dehydrogenase (ubiquinone) 1 beta subcomplex [Nesidiocoris tenuis]CAB0017475.1 unnamed protein product [Nesidiocoris tenuis]CAB0017478.1 unnamed protein product [Nesidiocoris tenuis]
MSPQDDSHRSGFDTLTNTLFNAIDGPITWFRKRIVEPNRKDYNWYHRQYKRVPTIDQCYTDDPVCKFEANMQFKRDKMVDNEILNILRQRFEDCVTYEAPDHVAKCTPLKEILDNATTNWFIKYGDLGGYGNAETAFIKQMNRLVWERRHGPVGSKKLEIQSE